MKPSPVVFVGVFIILFILLQFYGPIAENIGEIKPLFVLYGFVVAAVLIAIKQAKWHMLLRQIKPCSFRVSVSTYFPGQLVNEIAPTGAGDLTKAYLIKRQLKMRGGMAIATPYIERVIDILVLSSIAILSALFLFSAQFSVYMGLLYGAIILLSMLFLLLAFFPSKIAAVLGKVINIVTKLDIIFIRRFGFKINSFIINTAEEFQNALKTYKAKKKALFFPVIMAAIDWSLEGLCFLFLLKSVGFEIPLLPSIGIVGISWIVGIASMLPGGLGIREVAMSVLYSTYGIPFSSAFLATLIYRLIIFVYFGAGTMISLRIMKKQPIEPPTYNS